VLLNVIVSITYRFASRARAAQVGKIFLTPHAKLAYIIGIEDFTARKVL